MAHSAQYNLYGKLQDVLIERLELHTLRTPFSHNVVVFNRPYNLAYRVWKIS